ncbi:ABC transporter permease [Brevundimonas sp.]
MKPFELLRKNSRIIGAMMMREIVTRYGREGLGFFWLAAEPLLFCLFVIVLWSFMRANNEHGIGLGPFVMTGYMSMLIIRHVLSSCMAAVQANVGLLYHRQVSIIHIYASRIVLEFLGNSIAFLIVYIILLMLSQVQLPSDVILLIGGWTLLLVQSAGVSLILSGMAMRYDFIDRIVPVLQYGLIPISGAFVMAAWLPQEFRDILLRIPFPHAVEMIRAGVFGEFVKTYYDVNYAVLWAIGLNILGLLLVSRARHYLDVE